MSELKHIDVDDNTINYIKKIIDVAKIAGLDNTIIERHCVRACDDGTTVFMCHNTSIPPLPFDILCLTRLGVFSSRLDIAGSTGNAKITAAVVEDDQHNTLVRSLRLKGRGVSVDYRCASPTAIKAPKKVADPVTYSTLMTPDAVQMMIKGQAAMGADTLALIGGIDGVCLELRDNNNDALEYQISDSVTLEPSGDARVPDFFYRYPAKTMTALFKQNQDGRFYITARGIAVIMVNGITMYVMPRSD